MLNTIKNLLEDLVRAHTTAQRVSIAGKILKLVATDIFAPAPPTIEEVRAAMARVVLNPTIRTEEDAVAAITAELMKLPAFGGPGNLDAPVPDNPFDPPVTDPQVAQVNAVTSIFAAHAAAK